MELQRGVCSLCSENTRVLMSSDAEEFSKFLPEILYENFLPETEFQKIKKQIKVCLICCYKIKTAVESKNCFNNNKENESTRSVDECHFCRTNQNVVKIDSNWKNFVDRTEGFLTYQDFPLNACVGCVFYFDTIFNMKLKLIYKFPQLAVPVQKRKSPETTRKQGEISKKQNETPKRKSLSKSPPNSKKRKIFDDCFSYLQPLCNNNIYHLDAELKRDKRLYKKIAYVNLKNSQDVTVKETPKMRPIIKIKLKPKKESHVYVKMARSEELPSKSEHRQSKGRRYSHVEKRESSEEPEGNLDETPKAAATSSLVPKRRVSTYIDDEQDANKAASQENSEEIAHIIDKYKKEDEITDDDEKSEEIKDDGVIENGVEKLNTKISNKENEGNKDVANGEKSDILRESNEDEDENSKFITDDKSTTSSEANDSPKTPKNDSDSDGSDSDSSDKSKVKDNTESDSLNGSERKKKRVTFSDEII